MNTANRLTMLRMALVPVFILFFYIDIPGRNYYAAAVFVIAALTDIFDGALARKHNQITKFGKLIDPMADKLLVCSALVLLTARGWVHPVFVIVLVGREFVVSGLRMVAAAEGKVLAASGLGKAKTVVQIVAVVVVLMRGGVFETIGIGQAVVIAGVVLMSASVVLSVLSCVDYFIKNRDVVRDMFRRP